MTPTTTDVAIVVERTPREDLIAMLIGAEPILRQIQDRIGGAYRRDLARRMRRAIATEKRYLGVAVVLLALSSFCSMALASDQPERRPSWKPALVYGIALAADGISTERFWNLRDEKGTLWMHEQNPILAGSPDSRALRIGYYTLTGLAYTLLDRKLQPRHRKLAWVLRGVAGGMHIRAAANNTYGVSRVHEAMRQGLPGRPMEGLPNYRHPAPGSRR